MRALILKEVRGFLGSLIGFIVVAVFLLVTGLFLWVFPDNLLDLGYADLAPFFFIATSRSTLALRWTVRSSEL